MPELKCMLQTKGQKITQCFPYRYIRGAPRPPNGTPRPPWKVKLILFNFIFYKAPDHNRSHLRLPFLQNRSIACYFIKQNKQPHVIYLIYTTACNFCLYMVARLQFSALCIAHGGVPPRCAQTHTQTDTCAHTQVSTLPPADRIGLKNQCTATDT